MNRARQITLESYTAGKHHVLSKACSVHARLAQTYLLLALGCQQGAVPSLQAQPAHAGHRAPHTTSTHLLPLGKLRPSLITNAATGGSWAHAEVSPKETNDK